MTARPFVLLDDSLTKVAEGARGQTLLFERPAEIVVANDPSIDAGVWLPFAIGDVVWFDLDHDGVQDAGEAPVVGATVRLTNADGTAAVDAAGNPVAAATADADGSYLFDNLVPGDYTVEFEHGQAGYRWTVADAAAATDQTDSDAGFLLETDTAAATGTISLGVVLTGGVVTGTTGNTVVDADSATRAAYIDPTNDAGIWMPLAVGNLVWLDYDSDGVQDDTADEPGVEGVTVTLLDPAGDPVVDADGTTVAPVQTDATGHYLFDNLLPGTYQVVFSTVPEGHTPTAPDSGSDDNVDSDADTVTLAISNVVLSVPNADGSYPLEMSLNDQPATVNAYLVDPTEDLGLVLTPHATLKKYVTTPELSVPYDPADPATLGCDAQSLPTDGSAPADCQIAEWDGTMVYRVQVTNDGYIPLNVDAVEDVVDSTETCSALALIDPAVVPAVLGVGEAWTYQCEVDHVRHHFGNDATVWATPAFPDGTPIPNQPQLTSTDSAVIDPAQLQVGLGLDKTLVGVPTPGKVFDWDISVTNIGPDVAWGPVTVVDDLPVGFTGLPSSGDGWTCTNSGPDNRRIMCTTEGNILVDVPQTIRIRAQLTGAIPDSFRNEAYFAVPLTGNPLANPQNSGGGVNAGGLPALPAPTEDQTNPYLVFNADGAGTVGGGRSDNVPVQIFDLAQSIVYTSDTAGVPNDGVVAPNAGVTFTATIVNQGNVDATAVTLSVYVPAGLTLNDPNWTVTNGIAVLNTPIPLAAGATATRTITFTVTGPTGDLMVWSEISRADNAPGLLDWDSTADSTQSNDIYTTDNLVTGNGLGGSDEDDHDPATIRVVPAGALPRTGGDSRLPLQIGLGLLGLGSVLTVVTRRRRRVTA